MRRSLFYGRELFDVAKHIMKRLQKEEEKVLKDAQSGYKRFTDAERRNRKLRNKYCMAGRIW